LGFVIGNSCPNFVSNQLPHNRVLIMSSGSTGWKKEEYDPNDIPYRYRGKGDAYMMHNVNLIFGKPSWFHDSSGSVYDQGDSGSCVANACAAAYRYLAYKTTEEMAEADMNADAEVKRECPLLNDPSRLFCITMQDGSVGWWTTNFRRQRNPTLATKEVALGLHAWHPLEGCLFGRQMPVCFYQGFQEKG
jgi:hypothetical protein